MSGLTDAWTSGDAYERYVGRWSRLVAREFLGWLAVRHGGRWLDVGCGTGVLAEAVLDVAAPGEVVGIDPAVAFVSSARGRVADRRAHFEVGDARALSFRAATFDAVVSGLVLNFVPQPASAVAEMVRVARPGGIVAAYVWDYGGEMQMMRRFWDAAVELDSAASSLDEGRRFPVSQPEPLAGMFGAAGLSAVEVRALDVPTRFRDFDDYWTPFLGGQGPAPGYVASLGDERRAALRARLRDTLPTGPDGSIDLLARAWGVQGER